MPCREGLRRSLELCAGDGGVAGLHPALAGHALLQNVSGDGRAAVVLGRHPGESHRVL